MRLAIPLLLSALVLLLVVLLAPGIHVLPLLGLTAAAGVGLASLAPLYKRNLRRTPLYIWGMVIAHFGIAVSLAGMASESAFIKETLVASPIGETHRVGPYAVRLDDIEPIAGPNYTAIRATVTARRGDGTPFKIYPETRDFPSPQTETNEAAITTVLDGQLYVVVGKPDDDGRWQLRLWWKPFVTLIWAGGALVAFGGFLSLVGRVRRDLRHKPAPEFL
jgi:cytochrome c-type biogenesis protein CcmF